MDGIYLKCLISNHLITNKYNSCTISIYDITLKQYCEVNITISINNALVDGSFFKEKNAHQKVMTVKIHT